MNAIRSFWPAIVLMASMVAGGQEATQSPASPQKQQQVAPASPVSAEDAEIQALQKEHQQLLKQREIDKLRKENEALKSNQEGQQVQPLAPQADGAKQAQAALADCIKQESAKKHGPTLHIPKALYKPLGTVCDKSGVCIDDTTLRDMQKQGIPKACQALAQAASVAQKEQASK